MSRAPRCVLRFETAGTQQRPNRNATTWPDRSNQRLVASKVPETGVGWLTRDPDGHAILFDTNQNEEGESAARESVDLALRNAERDLIDAGASDACLEAYRQKILAPFLTANA